MATVEDVRAADLLLQDWLTKTPKVQAAALDAIFQRQNRLAKLLDALQQGAVPPSSLDTARREQLRENSDPEIRRRARELLAAQGVAKDRQEVLARYTDALALPRDAVRGEAVFQRQCAKCHRVKEQGYVVGPDLANTIRRTDEMLVSDMLDPSNQITAGYNSYTVVTEDGRIYSGVLAAESATHVTLRREEGKEDTILRKDIEEMAASRISMMPEKVEQEIKPQEMADLIAYLRQAFGPPLPAQVMLFDDDPGFVQVLNQGEGRAMLETADRFAGQRVAAHRAAAALVVADSRLGVPDRREPRARRVPVSAVRLEVVRRPGRDDRVGRPTATGRPRTSRSGGTTAARTPPAGPRVRSRPKRRSSGSR